MTWLLTLLRSDAMRPLLWAAAVVLLIGAAYVMGRSDGKRLERTAQAERQLTAMRAARQTEYDLAGIAAASAKRIAEKERLLHDQAQRQTADWRSLLAGMPRCRVPRAVGVQLDAASGAGATTAVAEPPAGRADAAALDSLVDLAVDLDTVRANYAIARRNADRLTEAERWYDEMRARVNRGAD